MGFVEFWHVLLKVITKKSIHVHVLTAGSTIYLLDKTSSASSHRGFCHGNAHLLLSEQKIEVYSV